MSGVRRNRRKTDIEFGLWGACGLFGEIAEVKPVRDNSRKHAQLGCYMIHFTW